MKTFHNKIIYETLGEIIEPEHTGLVVWDVQNALVNNIFNREEFLGNLKKLLNKAREKGVSVIYSKITPLPVHYNSSWNIYSMMKRYKVDDPSKLPQFMKPGTTDADITAEIEPSVEDVVLNKHTASLFIGTHIEYMLRNRGIETLIFTGIATEFGVASSARDASNRGFYPVIASDCVSSMDREMHEFTLKVMTRMSIVTTGAEIIKNWRLNE